MAWQPLAASAAAAGRPPLVCAPSAPAVLRQGSGHGGLFALGTRGRAAAAAALCSIAVRAAVRAAARAAARPRAMATNGRGDYGSGAKFKIGLCQTAVSADKAKSLENVRAAVSSAASKGAELVVCGEMLSCPYATKFFREYGERLPAAGAAAGADAPTVQLLVALAQQHKIWLVGGSLPELDGDKVYNTCLVLNPGGEIVARHRKAHLFDIDVPATETRPAMRFKESDVLSAGDELTLVDLPWCRAGVGVCYDVRFPEYALALRNRGARLLVYPGAFNMTTGPAHWTVLARARANDSQCYVAMVSPSRSPDPKAYQAWGHSSLVGPWAEVLFEAEHEPGAWVAEVDPSEVDRIRQQVPTSYQKRPDLYVPYADAGGPPAAPPEAGPEQGGSKRPRP